MHQPKPQPCPKPTRAEAGTFLFIMRADEDKAAYQYDPPLVVDELSASSCTVTRSSSVTNPRSCCNGNSFFTMLTGTRKVGHVVCSLPCPVRPFLVVRSFRTAPSFLSCFACCRRHPGTRTVEPSSLGCRAADPLVETREREHHRRHGGKSSHQKSKIALTPGLCAQQNSKIALTSRLDFAPSETRKSPSRLQ